MFIIYVCYFKSALMCAEETPRMIPVTVGATGNETRTSWFRLGAGLFGTGIVARGAAKAFSEGMSAGMSITGPAVTPVATKLGMGLGTGLLRSLGCGFSGRAAVGIFQQTQQCLKFLQRTPAQLPDIQ